MTTKAAENSAPREGLARSFSWPWGLGLPLVVVVGLKALLLAWDAFPFNADEAVVGLMARHILQGERPVFFYGQAYLGSLDAWLIAAGFTVAGAHVWVIRAVQVGLYLLTVGTSYLFALRATGSRLAAWAAAMLLAVPTVGVTLYTTVSLGGYGEALIIGNLILLTSLSLRAWPQRKRLWFGWGFLGGLGVWVFGLTLVYSLASVPFVLPSLLSRKGCRRRVGAVLAAALGGIVGAAPWLGWAVEHGLDSLVTELGGSAIAGASPTDWLAAIGSHFMNLLLFGPTVMMGLRPPWSVDVLVWPLVPLALIFWLGALGWAGMRRFRFGDDRAAGGLLLAVVAILLAGFLLSPFGADPSGRYFLPVYVVMAVVGGAWVAHLRHARGGTWAGAALGAVLLFNLVSTIQAARPMSPRLTTAFDPVAQVDTSYLPELAGFLETNGETRGYSNYWVAYPLAFISNERLVFIPTLPYHQDFRYTPRDDRYSPYDELVSKSSKVAYVTTNHPGLDDALSSGLDLRGVAFRDKWIGPYHVFYDLSRPVRLSAADLAPAGLKP